jgi:hypothetical protein
MSEPSARPGLVWAIAVFQTIAFLVLALVGWFLFTHWDVLPENVKASWRDISPMSHLFGGIGMALTLIATVQLFRLRRSAFYLYAIAVVVSITQSVPLYVRGAYHGYQFVGLTIQLLVCFYAWRLLRANLLS